MTCSARLQLAFSLACRLHGDQLRKGTGVPYITHVMAVSALVGEYGGDEDGMIAALLHDSLEDRGDRISLPELVERFGWRVGRIVMGCSDCTTRPKPPWIERKRAYVEQLRTEGSHVKIVAAADKLHNARALVRDVAELGDAAWSRFNAPKEQQCWYLRACVAALSDAWAHPLLCELDATVQRLEQLCGVASST